MTIADSEFHFAFRPLKNTSFRWMDDANGSCKGNERVLAKKRNSIFFRSEAIRSMSGQLLPKTDAGRRANIPHPQNATNLAPMAIVWRARIALPSYPMIVALNHTHHALFQPRRGGVRWGVFAHPGVPHYWKEIQNKEWNSWSLERLLVVAICK